MGDYGLCSLAEIFSGKVNPSGRTVDTYEVDAMNSPAAQNFGDFAYYDENGNLTKYNSSATKRASMLATAITRPVTRTRCWVRAMPVITTTMTL